MLGCWLTFQFWCWPILHLDGSQPAIANISFKEYVLYFEVYLIVAIDIYAILTGSSNSQSRKSPMKNYDIMMYVKWKYFLQKWAFWRFFIENWFCHTFCSSVTQNLVKVPCKCLYSFKVRLWRRQMIISFSNSF